jgi:MarR family transcriptional regulator, organic hydroperoxide resistance regulator
VTNVRQPAKAGRSVRSRREPPPTTSLPTLLEKGTDRAFRAAVEAGWRSAQSLNEIMTVIAAEVGISLPQYSIMMVLAYAEKGLSVGMLASRLRVSQPFVTAEIGKLVGAQLVFKRSNPADKRGVLIALSPKGHNVTNRIALLLREVNDMIYRDMTRKEVGVIKRFIEKLSLRTELALAHITNDRRSHRAGGGRSTQTTAR